MKSKNGNKTKYITFAVLIISLALLLLSNKIIGTKSSQSKSEFYKNPPAKIQGTEKRFRDSGIDFLYLEQLVNLGRVEDEGSIATLIDMQSPHTKDSKMMQIKLYAFALQADEMNMSALQILKDRFEATFKNLVEKKIILSFEITEERFNQNQIAKLYADEFVQKDKVITRIYLFKTDKSLYIVEAFSLAEEEVKMKTNIEFMLNTTTFYAPLPQNIPINNATTSKRGLLQ